MKLVYDIHGRLLTNRTLPSSREEALENPCTVVALHWNKKKTDFWIELSRPQSLQYDCGIKLSEPTNSGELICDAS